MNDPVFVSLLQPASRLQNALNGLLDGKRSVAFHHRSQIRPVDELHDQKWLFPNGRASYAVTMFGWFNRAATSTS